MNCTGDSQSPEEVILETLTCDGYHPAGHCFAVGRGALGIWVPEFGGFSMHMIDATPLAEACRQYLRSKGRWFNSWDEVSEWGEGQGWPEPEKLRLAVQSLKARAPYRGDRAGSPGQATAPATRRALRSPGGSLRSR